MSNPFFDQPILNSPYAYPRRHWELDANGQPTHRVLERRRKAEFITPIPKPKKWKKGQKKADAELEYGDETGVSTAQQQYEKTAQLVNAIRAEVDHWRDHFKPHEAQVTPETARLLEHWRHHAFSGPRPFFCQLEAVETVIWLTEVAPQSAKGKDFLRRLSEASDEANPGLDRLALKLATGAGKTTVMAMLIAWQTINAVRRPGSKRFTRGFLVVAPGLTIKDRLRVLFPNDTENYYSTRELVPTDLLPELQKAKIVVTNYHAFKLRERLEVAKGTRDLLRGPDGEPIATLETEGEMIRRAMDSLMGIKNVLVLNDEAHHCYREKPGDDGADLDGDEKKAVEKEREAARMWISGLEAVKRKLGLVRIYDLSATPFFLRGSGYAEGTLFPWTVSDFSLMDAIECGIVKLPRVPVSDNLPGAELPIYRNLWEHIGKKMPKKGAGKGAPLDPGKLPPELLTALDALYGHYAKTYTAWRDQGAAVPPCFIVVCNNTAVSKLVYEYISGYDRPDPTAGGAQQYTPGKLALFRNYDDHGQLLRRPVTLLIDSQQLESGEGLSDDFRAAATDEIERFRQEVVARDGAGAGDSIDDAKLLREVMNTVGKPGRLGEQIRCVVSVSMLTEGWDANTVTHVLGVRAFGTQLLCEQVIGRALRRQSYEVNDKGLFDVEYADILGIPFDFAAEPVVAKLKLPRPTTHVRAVRPERDALEIRFPRVEGYRVDLPSERIEATFTPESTLELTTDLTGPTEARNQGIIGKGVDLNLVHTGKVRDKEVLFHLTHRLLDTKFRDQNEQPKHHLFFPLMRVAERWYRDHFRCRAGTFPAQLMYRSLADMACERIATAITLRFAGERPIVALLDPYNSV
ncbi:MAG: BPTD_3080 family restriction endonuclease, partial [Lacipirellulaceae bacterium]